MNPVICFGEVMARLSPPNFFRLRQAMPGSLDVTFAGAEVNAAVAIAALGGRAEFVTALPRNEISDACLATLRGAAVGVERILLQDQGRFGLYFVEAGANQRAGNVLYDREASTFSITPAADYDWKRILQGANWFHTTGISAGVSRVAAEATVAGVQAARAAGLTVSCDLNYRRKLWRWNTALPPAELARCTLEQVLESVDVVMGNGADIAQAAGIDPQANGAHDAARIFADAEQVVHGFVRRFPNVRWVAMTLREGCSATHNRWGAMLFRSSDGARFLAPLQDGAYAPFEITNIIDRLGAGDAFAGALIFALQTPELSEPQTALRFAVSASCLAHSIPGDFNFCTRGEVEALMLGSNGSGVSR
jgi:2-dehydro-3-deoxygluconokinase